MREQTALIGALVLVQLVQPLHLLLRVVRIDDHLLDRDAEIDRGVRVRVGLITDDGVHVLVFSIGLYSSRHHPSPPVFPPEVKLPMYVRSSERKTFSVILLRAAR